MTAFSGVKTESLHEVGQNLNRPECVLCTADGSLYVADWGGGVTRIRPDGSQDQYLASDAPCPLLPNGIALQRDGSFLLANLGDAGGVWQLHRDGSVAPFVTEMDGQALPPCNFVLIDREGRVWITVSTRIEPRALAYRPDIADGFIIVVDEAGPRVVASGLGYTNEVHMHPSGDWVYVNETFAKRLSRFPVTPDGGLGARETVAVIGHGTFPDGLAFDEEGAAWVVSIVSNRVIRVEQNGRQTTVVEDADPAHVDWVEAAFASGSMGREHLDQVRSDRLRNLSSIAFGGPDRRTCYLGCLLGNSLVSFRAPVAGVEPAHWHVT